MPPLKLLNDEKQFGYLMYFVEKKLGRTANSREINTFENLKEFGGYDGIITKANGGAEIRILNPDKISEINKLNFNPKAVEQPLKETTKAETPTPKGNTSNVGVEEGSGGVGKHQAKKQNCITYQFF